MGAASILGEIAGRARIRVARAKEAVPAGPMRERAAALAGKAPGGPPPFEKALMRDGLSFICEVKKASPSKGVISPDFPYLQIARDYEAAGAAAVSVLTEPDFFMGRDGHLREIAAAVGIPALRKDFVVDAYQVCEARLLGAGAVLLICALLGDAELRECAAAAGELGMSALFEIRDEAEADRALRAGARIIGVNNRDLRTFEVDLGASAALRGRIPPGVLAVAESGVGSPADARALRDMAFDAALVGESLMRSKDRKRFLGELMGGGGP